MTRLQGSHQGENRAQCSGKKHISNVPLDNYLYHLQLFDPNGITTMMIIDFVCQCIELYTYQAQISAFAKVYSGLVLSPLWSLVKSEIFRKIV